MKQVVKKAFGVTALAVGIAAAGAGSASAADSPLGGLSSVTGKVGQIVPIEQLTNGVKAPLETAAAAQEAASKPTADGVTKPMSGLGDLTGAAGQQAKPAGQQGGNALNGLPLGQLSGALSN